MGDYAKAEPLYKQALQVLTKVLRCEHPSPDLLAHTVQR
jgi:hypothetical protein